jgi:hypothetical protein
MCGAHDEEIVTVRPITIRTPCEAPRYLKSDTSTRLDNDVDCHGTTGGA